MKIILSFLEEPPRFNVEIVDDDGVSLDSGWMVVTPSTTKADLEQFENNIIAGFEAKAKENQAQAIEAEKVAAANKAIVLADEIGIVADDGTLEKPYTPK